MDFRILDISRIAFDRAKPTRYKVRYGGGGDVMFQMPPYVATIEPHPRMPGSHQLRGMHSHEAFRDFVQSLKKHADESLPECAAKQYRDAFGALTLFESALVFDGDGCVTPLRCGTYSVSPLVKIDGTWMSEYSWGFSVEVQQLKLYQRVLDAPPPAPRIFIDGRPLLFVADDDVADVDAVGEPSGKLLFVPDEDTA